MPDKHVTRNPDGTWGDGHHRTQGQAIDATRDFIRQNGGGELVIHGRDGKIRDKDTVAPGNDPNPPKDRR